MSEEDEVTLSSEEMRAILLLVSILRCRTHAQRVLSGRNNHQGDIPGGTQDFDPLATHHADACVDGKTRTVHTQAVRRTINGMTTEKQ